MTCSALFRGLAVLAVLPMLAAAPKRPLSQSDFGAWRSLSSPALSRDGRVLAYAFMPQEGDGDLKVRDLKTGREWSHGAGALPPPPIQPPEEVNPEAPIPQPSIRIAITSDGRFVVATTYPPRAETDRAKKAKKKPEEMPKGGLLIVDTASGAAVRLEAVKNVQVPAKGGAWAAYLKEPKAEAKKEEPARAEPAAGPRRPAPDKKEYGSDLVLRDLASGAERTFADVLEYSFARDGRTLLFAVASRSEERNGVFAFTPGAAEPVALLAGRGRYLKLTWDREQRQAAWVSNRDDAAAQAPAFKAYLWDRGQAAAREAVSAATPGFPRDLAVADKGTLGFSRDGRKLYLPAAAPARPPRDPKESDENADDKVVADLWHWQDDQVQPIQRVRANQERNRTYRGVLHIAEQRYVQVSDPTLATVSFNDDGSRAIGFDDRAYRRRTDYDGAYADLWRLDTGSGARSLALKEFRGGFGGRGGGPLAWSPDGRHAAFFADRHWHLLDASSGAIRNLTAALAAAFQREDHDTPDAPPAWGSAGWTRDSKAFLAYDRYDVWVLPADGGAPRNLTAGAGRSQRIELRVARIDPIDEEDEDRGLDPARPVTFRGEHETTRASGFFRKAFDSAAAPERLLWAAKNHRFVARARDAETVLISASRFDEYPDLQQTDTGFRNPVKVTAGGAQLEPFLWGSGELLDFRNANGTYLQAALYKPAGFDPKRKYPLLVYIYERLSQGVHGFVNPAPSHNPNPSLYTSNGYLVLMPDIVYTLGQPGRSALDCVLPAIQALVDRGCVDEQAIGIAGHSWGGYQIAYMVTQTDRFRAAECGAPVGNMTSAYSGIRWGSGQPRQFQYEKTQSRIGPSLYEAPLKYLENSPVFHVDRVRTPLLILHDDMDDAVPWYQGIELFLALRRHAKEAYLFNYNGEFHGLRRRADAKDFARRTQQYFDHFLKGAAKPEWMEKGIPFLDREDEKIRFSKESLR